jgi:hypothetical protein
MSKAVKFPDLVCSHKMTEEELVGILREALRSGRFISGQTVLLHGLLVDMW